MYVLHAITRTASENIPRRVTSFFVSFKKKLYNAHFLYFFDKPSFCIIFSARFFLKVKIWQCLRMFNTEERTRARYNKFVCLIFDYQDSQLAWTCATSLAMQTGVRLQNLLPIPMQSQHHAYTYVTWN